MGELSEIPSKGVKQRRGETKFLKRGQAGSRGECLKKEEGGLEPLYKLWVAI